MKSALVRAGEEMATKLEAASFITWVEKTTVERAVSFGEIWARSGNLASMLPGEGERALLVYAPGPEFFVTFLACLRMGVVAVPCYPPDPTNLTKSLAKLDLVAKDCEPAVALCDTAVDLVRLATKLFVSWPGVPWRRTDGDAPSQATRVRASLDRLSEFQRQDDDDVDAVVSEVMSALRTSGLDDDDDDSTTQGDSLTNDQRESLAFVRDSLVGTLSEERKSVSRRSEYLRTSPTTGKRRSSSTSDHQLAFLQFTSGSTGNPKGVMISHGNLWSNIFEQYLPVIRASVERVRGPTMLPYMTSSQRLTGVSMLPHCHDTGLVLMLLGPFCGGWHMVHMSPVTFLGSPTLWLKVMSQHKAHWSAMPDFCYQLIFKRLGGSSEIETFLRDEGIDLSNVLKLGAGVGQRCRPSQLDAFMRKVGKKVNLGATTARGSSGETVWLPSYGLAEHVVATTFEDDGVVASTSNPALISCGSKFRCDLRIVDPETRVQVRDGQLGEVWIRSKAVRRLGVLGEARPFESDVLCGNQTSKGQLSTDR